MKKFLPLSLLMFALMLVSAWSIQWFLQASHIKTDLQRSLKPTSLDISGFPWQIIATLTDPSVELATKPRLRYALHGRASLRINAWSDQLQLEYEGSSSLQSLDAGAPMLLAVEHLSSSHCSLQRTRGLLSVMNALWDLTAFTSSTDWMADLQQMQCDLPATIITNARNHGEILATFSPTQYNMTPEKLTLRMETVEIFPAGENLLAAVWRAFFREDPQAPVRIPTATSRVNFQVSGKNPAEMLENMRHQFILALMPFVAPPMSGAAPSAP